MKSPPNQVFHKPYAGEQVVTADGAPIAEGLRVWTNDLETGEITLIDAEYEWNASAGRYVLWFKVIRDSHPGERGVHQSDDRVATRNPFTHKRA
ncbi:hypothetical protein [Mycolicibacterium llatzerense]|uniref:hypothetical protein n=1 Tax=Mycolicibacterium llatzerense TaxID=280871 RepID=UPI0008DC8A1B|nr:hypothetical protein [Mycolicibacterium llatzerense]